MTTVFLSGSRKIHQLNEDVRDRLRTLLVHDPAILVGDAQGADTAFQKYFAALSYANVTIYCAGGTCRKNLGNWEVRHIAVDTKLKNRAFYTLKDQAMAAHADSGLVLWDGKSPGSLNNIMELIKGNKRALVYFYPDNAFHDLSNLDDAQRLFQKCEQADLKDARHALRLISPFQEREYATQLSLFHSINHALK